MDARRRLEARRGLLTLEEFATSLDAIDKTKSRYENYSHFLEAAYCSLAFETAFDARRAGALQTRFRAVEAQYSRKSTEAMQGLSQLFGQFVRTVRDYDGDFLGELFMFAEFGKLNPQAKQFFTPYALSELIARCQLPEEDVRELVAQRRPFTVLDPAAGAGSLIIAATEAVWALQLDPAEVMPVTLVDIDSTCMKMAFLQLWAKQIPAICVHGNSLTLEEFECAYNPWGLHQAWRRLREPDDDVLAAAAHASAARAAAEGAESPARAETPRPLPDIVLQRDLFG